VLGLLAGPRFGDYQPDFDSAGSATNWSNSAAEALPGQTYFNFGSIVHALDETCPGWPRSGASRVEAANQIGDLTFAAYCCTHLNTNLLAAGDPLDEVQGEAERGLAFAQKMRFVLAIDSIAAQLGSIRTLRGSTANFGCFDDEQFDELRMERRLSSNPDLALPECWYWIRKLQARLLCRRLCGRPRGFIEGATAAVDIASMFETAEYHFYSALSKQHPASPQRPTSGGSMSRL